MVTFVRPNIGDDIENTGIAFQGSAVDMNPVLQMPAGFATSEPEDFNGRPALQSHEPHSLSLIATTPDNFRPVQ